MSAVIRFRRSGRVVYVVGSVPVKAGDRFDATEDPPAQPRGCTFGETAGGATYFSCSRGRTAPRLKSYVFSPDIHAVIAVP
jgi:hypothetical protein